MGAVKKFIRLVCLRTGRFGHLYATFGTPNSWDWAEFQRRRGHDIGEGTTINPGAQLMDDHGLLRIGRNCSISYASFVTHSGGDRVIRDVWSLDVNSSRPIVVGDNCIIGCNATIMYGVTIGNDCVIGAGSYVCRDVPAGTVMRPLEAVPVGTTKDYVERLRRRVNSGRLMTPPVAPSGKRDRERPRFVLPGRQTLVRFAFAFGAGAMLVPSPFFNDGPPHYFTTSPVEPLEPVNRLLHVRHLPDSRSGNVEVHLSAR